VLRLLLDEHVARAAAAGLRRRMPALTVIAMAEWDNGIFLGAEDATCLRQAQRQGLTLVTYDRRTIPALLKGWTESGRSHGGIILVDEKTIAPGDVGGLVRSLTALAREAHGWEWTDRVVYLRRVERRVGGKTTELS
jgi:hypothetical protein